MSTKAVRASAKGPASSRVECKTIQAGRRAVQLSSIAGWTVDHLPKVLVVAEFSKEMADRAPARGKKIKPKDLRARIVRQSLYTIRDLELFVPWDDTLPLARVTSTKAHEDPGFYAELRELCRRQNGAFADRPAKLNCMKNSGGRLRVYYQCADHTLLPAASSDLVEALGLRDLVGLEITLLKDYSDLGGPLGEYNQDMVDFEYANGVKRHGDVLLTYPDGTMSATPKHPQSRQDFWTGYVFEDVLAARVEGLEKLPVGTVGADLELLRLARDGTLPVPDGLPKTAVLREIQRVLGIEARDSDISAGSTITLSALRRVHDALAEVDAYTPTTKGEAIRATLHSVDMPSEEEDVSSGGTVTTAALVKVLRGMYARGFYTQG
ncbi:MAG: hypothetical protein ACYTG6_12820 [Planctomycetota bacterium]